MMNLGWVRKKGKTTTIYEAKGEYAWVIVKMDSDNVGLFRSGQSVHLPDGWTLELAITFVEGEEREARLDTKLKEYAHKVKDLTELYLNAPKFWRRGNGTFVEVSKMDDTHLKNTIKFVEKEFSKMYDGEDFYRFGRTPSSTFPIYDHLVRESRRREGRTP